MCFLTWFLANSQALTPSIATFSLPVFERIMHYYSIPGNTLQLMVGGQHSDNQLWWIHSFYFCFAHRYLHKLCSITGLCSYGFVLFFAIWNKSLYPRELFTPYLNTAFLWSPPALPKHHSSPLCLSSSRSWQRDSFPYCTSPCISLSHTGNIIWLIAGFLFSCAMRYQTACYHLTWGIRHITLLLMQSEKTKQHCLHLIIHTFPQSINYDRKKTISINFLLGRLLRLLIE